MKTADIKNLPRDVDEFTLAYIECALWTSHDGDENYFNSLGWTKLSKDTLAMMIADCVKFQAQNKLALDGYPAKQAGHDFWLTRNGHGAGFWENDYGSETQNEMLTNACHEFGECNLYLGDDGKIYAE